MVGVWCLVEVAQCVQYVVRSCAARVPLAWALAGGLAPRPVIAAPWPSSSRLANAISITTPHPSMHCSLSDQLFSSGRITMSRLPEGHTYL
jgi:hypothetical protein